MTKKQYYIVSMGTLMMLLLGIVYSYSLFRLELEESLDLSTIESGIPYMTVLLFYALFMMIGGKLYHIMQAKYVVIIGSVLIGSGFIFSSFSDSIWLITLFYGVLIGSGIGLLYSFPMQVVAQMNHKRIGFLTGITLMGFGLSPLVFAPIIQRLLTDVGLSMTFLILGILYIPILLLLSRQLLLHYTDTFEEKVSSKVYKNPTFYIVYSLFFIATFVGLTIIGLSGTIGVELANYTEAQVAIWIGLFAVANGIGRPLFGYLNDRIGFVRSALLSFGSMLFVSVLYASLLDSRFMFVFASIIYFINFGGWLSLAPSATLQLFEKKAYARNYGYMFTAYGVGAFIGTLLSGVILETLTYQVFFLGIGFFSLIGAFITIIFKKKLTQ